METIFKKNNLTGVTALKTAVIWIIWFNNQSNNKTTQPSIKTHQNKIQKMLHSLTTNMMKMLVIKKVHM